MKNKIVGMVVLMLVATTVVSATNINVKESNNVSVNSEPYEPGLFDWWSVDQKQTHQDGTGMTLTPPETNAQSFTPTKDKLTAVSLYIFKASTPPEPVQITVSIRDNLTGSNLATKTIDTSVVTIKSSGTWVLFDFEDISLTSENTYYMVCTGTAGDATNAYVWLFADNDTYTRGEPWYKATENYPWMKNHMAGDFCFKTYFRKPLDVSSTQKNNEMVNPTQYSVDVPVWKKGDSWTYNFHELEYKYDSNDTIWYKVYHNCTLTYKVTDATGDNYIIKATSTDNEGRVTIGKYQLKFTPFTKYLGETIIRKTDLAVLRDVQQKKGFVFWLVGNIFPFPAQYNSVREANYTSGYQALPFPLNAGTPGTIPGTNQIVQEKGALYWGLISLFDRPAQTSFISPTDYNCEMANITVPAGIYNAYNVSIELHYGMGHYTSWRYYVPEVGWQAKLHFNADYDTSGKPGIIAELELVDFNYTP